MGGRQDALDKKCRHRLIWDKEDCSIGATEDSPGPGPDCIAVRQGPDYGWRMALPKGQVMATSFDIFSVIVTCNYVCTR